jgi:hypothetical protein
VARRDCPTALTGWPQVESSLFTLCLDASDRHPSIDTTATRLLHNFGVNRWCLPACYTYSRSAQLVAVIAARTVTASMHWVVWRSPSGCAFVCVLRTSPCGCRGGVTCLWNCVTALPRCGAVLAAAMGSASAHRTVDLLLCSSVVGSIPSAKRLSDCRCVRFDKLNLIIGADGVAATVFEHSPVDGHTMLPFVDVQPRNCRARRRLTVWFDRSTGAARCGLQR